MKIGIGSDHAGYRYKEEIRKYLELPAPWSDIA